MKNMGKEVARQPWKRKPPKTHPSPSAWRMEGPANKGSPVPPYILGGDLPLSKQSRKAPCLWCGVVDS